MNCSECKAPGMCICGPSAPAPTKPFVQIDDKLVEYLAKRHFTRMLGTIYAQASPAERAEFPFEEYCGTWGECGPCWNEEKDFKRAKEGSRREVRSILKDLNRVAREATIDPT